MKKLVLLCLMDLRLDQLVRDSEYLVHNVATKSDLQQQQQQQEAIAAASEHHSPTKNS